MSNVIKYDDIQQRAVRSILMEAPFIDFGHIAKFCLNSEGAIIDIDQVSQVIVWSVIAIVLLIFSGLWP